MAKTVVKKIKPYPIDAKLVSEKGELKCQLVKLVEHGGLIEVGDNMLLVGEKGEIQFSLPLFGYEVVEGIKVIKTYDHYRGANFIDGNPVRFLVEIHFQGPKRENQNAIKQFLVKIGQPK